MIKFTKYHGCGNDFIIVNKKDIGDADYAKTAISWCHRTTGIGADGLIIVNENPQPDIPVEMIIHNSDGTLAPMCGNGIRCFAQYCYDEGIVKEDIYPVKTGAGTMIVGVQSRDPFEVEIDMGKPDFNPGASAIDTDIPQFIDQKINVSDVMGEDYPPDGLEIYVKLSTFFMGTIHTVVWEDDGFSTDAFNENEASSVALIGKGEPSIESRLSDYKIFKDKTNVNMVTPINRDTIKLRTYERGAGFTYACGTGACASVVDGIRAGKLNDRVKVILPFGELIITQKEDGTIFMQGPSQKIAEGQCFV